MSYILEALKKAEKQRDLGQVPGIGSVHEVGSRGSNRRWQWVLAAILILNAAVIGAVFWPSEDPKNTLAPSEKSPLDPVARQPAASPSGRPEAPEAPAPETVTASEGEAASATRPIADAHPVPLSPESADSEARPLKPLPLPQVPPQLPQPAESNRQPTSSLASSRNTSVPAPKPKRLPVWPLVADDLFHQINSGLNVDVHVYNKNPEKRFVFLNMHIYHEGDQLLEGPQLEEITQDGVVLSFRGEWFRVPAR